MWTILPMRLHHWMPISFLISESIVIFIPKRSRDISLGVKINNLFDEEYESNGWIYRFRSEDYNPVPDDPYAGNENGTLYHQKGYFPQAWRNIMVQLNLISEDDMKTSYFNNSR
jgi:hypothetical protein